MSFISKSVVAAVLAGGAVAAQGSVTVDGYSWDYAYTGDAVPTASSPAWTTAGSGSFSASGGILTVDTTTDDGRYFQINTGTEWNPTPSGTAYVQFKVKVNSENGNFAGGLYVGGQGRSINMNIGADGGFSGVFDNSETNIVNNLDVTQYHTYRVAFRPDVSENSYTLWIDDMTPANYVASGTLYSGSGYMYFGDGGGSQQGSMDWDYIAWNNNGAPVAVPEPAALSLLGLAGLLGLRRQRRR